MTTTIDNSVQGVAWDKVRKYLLKYTFAHKSGDKRFYHAEYCGLKHEYEEQFKVKFDLRERPK